MSEMNLYELKTKEEEEEEEELTCNNNYFKYCLYKEKRIAKWKGNFDREDDLIVYKEKR